MARQLFFFHNPKAGGTSVFDALSALFPAARRCPRIENDATDHAARGGRYEMFRGYDFYGGHYGRDVYDAVGRGIPTATNFRWPVDRVVSVYCYFRNVVELTEEEARDPRFRAVSLSKRLSLDDFVTCDDPAVVLHTCDHHFRQLTGSGWSPLYAQDMASARTLVDHMRWFYVCEHPYESVAWAEAAFAGRLANVQRLNVTRAADDGGGALRPKAYRRLVAQNQRDISLYQYALSRLLAETVEADMLMSA